MASPDLRTYTDLVLYDRTPADLVERALLDAAVKLPGWTPREGNTEVVLIEALSLEVAELVYAVNRLPGAVVEVLVRLLGVTRSEGAPAAATATFELVDDTGYVIPAGTVVRVDGAEEGTGFFVTDADLVVAPGNTEGTVGITAEEAGTALNGTVAGTSLTIVDALFVANGAVLASPVAGGTDLEDVAAWLNRGVERLSRLTDALILPEHFTSAALEDPRVGRATTVDNTDPLVGPAGANEGNVTVVIADGSGTALDAGIMSDIELDLEARSAAMLNVHVIGPTVTAVDVDVTVVRLTGADPADVEAAVEAAVDTYLDPAAWPWAGTVRRNELIALVDGVAGVDYVASLTAPAADVVLTGYGPLADAGAVAVAVNAP